MSNLNLPLKGKEQEAGYLSRSADYFCFDRILDYEFYETIIMKSAISMLRVRYDEVDQMGFVYHGNYAKYIHISRTNLLRKMGICDMTLESQNILMPVIEMSIKYIKPVYYDDLIKIKTTLKKLSGTKLEFDHLVYNPDNEIINKASSTLVFVDNNTKKGFMDFLNFP